MMEKAINAARFMESIAVATNLVPLAAASVRYELVAGTLYLPSNYQLAHDAQ
jgi:hypothetical protein